MIHSPIIRRGLSGEVVLVLAASRPTAPPTDGTSDQ